jgi:hypothetical protein
MGLLLFVGAELTAGGRERPLNVAGECVDARHGRLFVLHIPDI